jgi:hypothetical protein
MSALGQKRSFPGMRRLTNIPTQIHDRLVRPKRLLFALSKPPASSAAERAPRRLAHEEISGSHTDFAVPVHVGSQPIQEKTLRKARHPIGQQRNLQPWSGNLSLPQPDSTIPSPEYFAQPEFHPGLRGPLHSQAHWRRMRGPVRIDPIGFGKPSLNLRFAPKADMHAHRVAVISARARTCRQRSACV